jgi:hypothetical protein
MQARERQFHLGLDSRDLRDLESGRLTDRVRKERGLSETSLAADHDHTALAFSNLRQQPGQVLPLAGPADERRRPLDGHAPSLNRASLVSQKHLPRSLLVVADEANFGPRRRGFASEPCRVLLRLHA